MSIIRYVTYAVRCDAPPEDCVGVDVCTEEHEDFPGENRRHLVTQMEMLGWTQLDDGTHRCPFHSVLPKGNHQCRHCGYWMEGDYNRAPDGPEGNTARADADRQMKRGYCDVCWVEHVLPAKPFWRNL